jgi:GNAT superfamily N-acetyltransferase
MTPSARRRPDLRIRALRIEDVDEVQRLMRRAVEHGCSAHYDETQRDAILGVYARSLFMDTLRPYESLLAEEEDRRIVGFAQLDPSRDQLRALFVEPAAQGRGVGRSLLDEIAARAWRLGCRHVRGAMALNAVTFYERAGFEPLGEEKMLTDASVLVPVLWMEKRVSAPRPVAL